MFKPIIRIVQVYNNSFIPLTIQQWDTLSATNINIDFLVKFSEKRNELTN